MPKATNKQTAEEENTGEERSHGRRNDLITLKWLRRREPTPKQEVDGTEDGGVGGGGVVWRHPGWSLSETTPCICVYVSVCVCVCAASSCGSDSCFKSHRWSDVSGEGIKTREGDGGTEGTGGQRGPYLWFQSDVVSDCCESLCCRISFISYWCYFFFSGLLPACNGNSRVF